MKITAVRTALYQYTLSRPIGDVHLPGGVRTGCDLAVFIDTDEGVTGTTIGAASAESFIPGLAELLIGRDPRSTRALWQRMTDSSFKPGFVGPLKLAVSAIDCALWDVRARYNGVPLWKELGGGSPRVPVYASGLDTPLSDEELYAFYAGMASRGVTAGKIKVGKDRREDLRRLGIMADALASTGSLASVMIDANEFWSPKQAVQHVREIEASYMLDWVEEPVGRHDVAGLRRVSDAISAPVATGENLDSSRDYARLVAAGAVDVVQIGCQAGGITGALQVAELAYAHQLPVAMMNCPGRFMAHVAAALPHHVRMEVIDVGRDAVLASQPGIVDGHIVLDADAPGSGIEFDESKLAQQSVHGQTVPSLSTLYSRAANAGGVG